MQKFIRVLLICVGSAAVISSAEIQNAGTNATIAVKSLAANQSSNASQTVSENATTPKTGQTNAPPQSTAVEKAAQKPPPTHLRFQDDWSTAYPQCSVTHGFSTPIDIVTKKAVHVEKRLRTLMLYSYEPIKHYYLQTWYNDTENNIVMSALTITLPDSVFFEASYINGLGFEEFQLFQRAVFFMSKKPLAAAQSHHRIDGRKFPMELMLTFTNRKNDSGPIRNTTQIFVLIEIQKYDNPNFFPVVEAAKKILKLKSKSEEILILTSALDLYNKNLTQLTQAFNKGGNAKEIDALKPLMTQAKRAIKRLKSLEKSSVSLEISKNATQKRLELEDYKTEYDQLNALLEESALNYSMVAKTLKKTRDMRLLKDLEVIMLEMEELKRLIGGFRGVLGSSFHELSATNASFEKSKLEAQAQAALVRNLTAQITGNETLENGTSLVTFFEKQVKLSTQIQELKTKISEAEVELERAKSAIGWKQKLDTFQITWLFPDGGGVYFYNGSSPLPPCHRFRTTIVLENPVGISQAQYDTLASIPAYEGFEQVAQSVAPKLGALGTRTVWFNKKNIQWQRDDGVHMKSIVRRKFRAGM